MSAEKVVLTKGEALCLAWLVNNAGGLDRNGARIVVELQNLFELNMIEEYPHTEWPEQYGEEQTVSQVSLHWIKDQIENAFQARRVPAALARSILSLSDKVDASVMK